MTLTGTVRDAVPDESRTIHGKGDDLNSKVLTAVALVTGGFAILVGAWGLIAPGEMQTPSEVQQSIRWAAAGVLGAAISAVGATLLYAMRGRA